MHQRNLLCVLCLIGCSSQQSETLDRATMSEELGLEQLDVPVIDAAQLLEIRGRETARATAARASTLADATLRAVIPADADLRIVRVLTDEQGITHTRLGVTVDGVPLHGVMAIAHTGPRDDLQPASVPQRWSTAPVVARATAKLTPDEAIRLGLGKTAGATSLEPPQARLVYYPVVDGQPWRLVYLVNAPVLDRGTAHDWLSVISAETGEVFSTRDVLSHAAALATGNGIYNKNIEFTTNYLENLQLYELLTPGAGGKDERVRTFLPMEQTYGSYRSSLNKWGNPLTLSTFTCDDVTTCTSLHGQSAAVDVFYGLGWARRLHQEVFQRSGVLGTGAGVLGTVHVFSTGGAYALPSGQAYFSDSCCEGQVPTALTTLDVVGHELGHIFFWAATSDSRTVGGETGALDEGIADIFGVLTDFHEHAKSTPVPFSVTNWTIGEQTPIPTQLPRYFVRPSNDFFSWDYFEDWSATADLHHLSGPIRRAFYFLAWGAAAQGNDASKHFPSGFLGLGTEKAAKIWHKAITSYLPDVPTFADMRSAAVSAAASIHGTCTPEYKTVLDSFRAVTIGKAADRKAPTFHVADGGATYARQQDYIVTISAAVADVAESGNHESSGVYNFKIEADWGYRFSNYSLTELTTHFDALTIPAGVHTVTMTVKDNCQNIATKTVTFTVDHAPYSPGPPGMPAACDPANPCNEIEGSIDIECDDDGCICSGSGNGYGTFRHGVASCAARVCSSRWTLRVSAPPPGGHGGASTRVPCGGSPCGDGEIWCEGGYIDGSDPSRGRYYSCCPYGATACVAAGQPGPPVCL